MYALKSLTVVANQSISVLIVALLMILVLCSPDVDADTEPPDIEWLTIHGGDDNDRVFKIIQATDSGYVALAATNSFAEVDDDYYLVKFDQSGDTLWTQAYHDSGGTAPRDLIQTHDGGFMICGNETTYNPDSIYFAMKTDGLGEPMWVRRLGGTGWPNAVTQTGDSGYVFAGFTREGGSGIGLPSLLKLNQSGDSLWARVFGDSIRFSDVLQVTSGNIVGCGPYNAVSPYGVYIGGFDDSGHVVWSHCLQSDSSQSANSISHRFGRIFAAGSHGFRSGVWIVDTAGNLIDSVYFGDSTETVMSIDATLDGGFVTCGNTRFSSPPPATGTTRIRKFDAELSQEWMVEVDSTVLELDSRSIQQTNTGGYIYCGRTYNNVTDVDIYALKLASQIPHLSEFLIDGSGPGDHLISHIPELSWIVIDPAGIGQAEFEIQVGADRQWDVVEMWETGIVVSSDTSVIYAGNPLTDGETYYLRIHVSNGVDWSPWYNTSFRMNSVPSVPIPLHPINDTVVGQQPTLWIQNSTDTEGDVLTYDFWVVVDTLYGEPDPQEAFDVAETSDSTGWQVPLPLDENKRYWWRTRAHDSYEYSDWTDLYSSAFFVDGSPEAPTAPTPIWPPDTSGLPVFNMMPTIIWGASFDPDPFDSLLYTLELAVDPDFTFVNTIDSISGTEYTLGDSLNFSTQYWWRVSAFDVTGLTTMSEFTKTFWTWTLGDMDHNHDVDIADLVFLVTYMFQEGPAPYPLFIMDINGDCTGPDIADLIHLVAYMFQDGPAPVPCT